MMDGMSRGADEDFAAIEATVSATFRGRWFLAEYARRHRAADIGALIEAIGRIERAISERQGESGSAIRTSIAAMAEAIEDARRRVEAPTSSGASGEPTSDGVARRLQVATSAILDATERVQEAAWTLRESGADPGICDLLDGRATDIYAACETHGEVAAEVARGFQLLSLLEERIEGLREPRIATDAPVLQAGEARIGLEGDDLVFTVAQPAADRDAASVGAGGAPTTYPRTFAEIDALDIRDKLRLFT
jgi:hypothetical protein